MYNKYRDFEKLIDKYTHEIDIIKERIKMAICQELKDLTGLKFFAYGQTEEKVLFVLDDDNGFGNISVGFDRESFSFKGCIIYNDKYEKIKDKIDNYFDGNYDEE